MATDKVTIPFRRLLIYGLNGEPIGVAAIMEEKIPDDRGYYFLAQTYRATRGETVETYSLKMVLGEST
jgi:hypothetical protein